MYELTHTNYLIIIKYVKNLFNIFCHGLNHIIYILNNSIFIIHQYYVHTPPPYHQYIYVNVIYKINIHIKKLKIMIIIIIDNNFINNHNNNNTIVEYVLYLVDSFGECKYCSFIIISFGHNHILYIE